MSASHLNLRISIFWKQALLCVAILLALPAAGWGVAENDENRVQNPQSLFYQANAFYENGRYAEAAGLYLNLIRSGYESGNLYFNLGNTYFKLGRRGLAVLYYEKAKRLIPHDADLKANLAYALEGVDEGTPDWKGEFLRSIINAFPTEQLILLTSLSFFLVTAMIILVILFPEKIRVPGDGSGRTGYQAWWLGCVFLLGLFFLFSLSLTGLQYLDRLTPYGVAISAGGEVRYEPSKEATIHFSLAEGSRVKITGEKDDWYLIVRSDGRRGWVKKSYVEEV